MKYAHTVFLLTCLIVAGFFSSSLALVEWDVQRTLKLEKQPLDAAVSLDGRWIFVLTHEGSILVYSPDGTLMDEMAVGRHIDTISVGPREDMLLLTSRRNKTVHHINLHFIHDIDISGSPFKGPADAPVAIAVFNDFQ